MRQTKKKTRPQTSHFFQNLGQSVSNQLATLKWSEDITQPQKNLTLPQQEENLFKWLLVLPGLWLFSQIIYTFTGQSFSVPSFFLVSFSFLTAYLLFSSQFQSLKALLSQFFLWNLVLQWQSLAAHRPISRFFTFLLETLIFLSFFAYIFLRADPKQKRKSLALLRLSKLLISLVIILGTFVHLYFAFRQEVSFAFNLYRLTLLLALPLLAFTNMGEFDQEAWFIQLRYQIFSLIPLILFLTNLTDAFSNIFLLKQVQALTILNLFVLKFLDFLSLYVFIHILQKLSLTPFKLKKFNLKTSDSSESKEQTKTDFITHLENPNWVQTQFSDSVTENISPLASPIQDEKTRSTFVSPAFGQTDDEHQYYQNMQEDEIQHLLKQAAQSMEKSRQSSDDFYNFNEMENPSLPTQNNTENETEDLSLLNLETPLYDNWLNPYGETDSLFEESLTHHDSNYLHENLASPSQTPQTTDAYEPAAKAGLTLPLVLNTAEETLNTTAHTEATQEASTTLPPRPIIKRI